MVGHVTFRLHRYLCPGAYPITIIASSIPLPYENTYASELMQQVITRKNKVLFREHVQREMKISRLDWE